MIGEILGNRYKILRDLGSGGMAWVYLAEDTKQGGLVAVKVLYPQFSLDMAYLQRFVREAKVVSGLANPYIVKVLDYGSTRDIHYLVMEYIEGRDLKEALADRGALPWREALPIARQVALALGHAAQFGVVHRDIKPQNLMIGEDGIVKVLDFGIARAMTMPSLTQSGFVGSPFYISPEQAMGEPVDIRSDIYSLGIVLYEMLTGRVPYNSDNPWSIISQHIADELPLLAGPGMDIPPAVEQLVYTTLARQREDRFQTPAELVEAVDAVLAGKELPLHKKSAEPRPEANPVGSELVYPEMGGKNTDRQVTQFNMPVSMGEVGPGTTQRDRPTASGLEYRNQAAVPSPLGSAQTAIVDRKPIDEPVAAARQPPLWRRWPIWVLVLVVVAAGSLFAVAEIGEQRPVQNLRERYARAMGLSNQGQWEEAAKEFEIILAIAPDYADVASRKEEAIKQWGLERLYREGQTQYETKHWAEAITALTQLRSLDLTFRQPSVDSMLCDAYHEQARALSSGTDVKSLESAISLLEQGLKICPTDTEMLADRKWAEDYQQAVLDVQAAQWEKATGELTTLEELDLSSNDLRIASLLYQAYMGLAAKKENESDLTQALSNYKQALAVPGVDHGQAEQKRVELEKLLATPTPTPTSTATSTPTATATWTPTSTSTATWTVTATPRPTIVVTQTVTALPELGLQRTSTPGSATSTKYAAPTLLSPEDGIVYAAGEHHKIVLRWEGPPKLAEGEYYDVTVFHFYNQAVVYWGTNTRGTSAELPPDIGFGKVDKDAFQWYVTIRMTQTVKDGKPDGPPISPPSKQWNFTWR